MPSHCSDDCSSDCRTKLKIEGITLAKGFPKELFESIQSLNNKLIDQEQEVSRLKNERKSLKRNAKTLKESIKKKIEQEGDKDKKDKKK